MVRRLALVLFLTGLWQQAASAQGLSLLQLRNKAVAAYKTCTRTHSIRSCKRALTLYEQADALVPGNAKIRARIKKLRRMIARLSTPWWKRKYRNIFAAVKAHDIKACKAFLEHGVSPDIRDPQGRTPMHYAARAGYVDIAKLLHANKGRLDLQDNDGNTPIDLATPRVKQAFMASLKIHSIPDAEVTVDGHGAGTTDASGDLVIKLAGGEHAIGVHKKGYTPAKTRVTLKWADHQIVTMVLAKIVAPVVVKKREPKAVTPIETKTKPLPVAVGKAKKRSRTWGYVTLFSGLAIAGLGGGMTGLAIHERSAMNDAKTSADLDAGRSKIKTYNAVAITSYIVGAGLIGTGIYLLVRPEKQKTRHSVIMPVVGSGVVGAMVDF